MTASGDAATLSAALTQLTAFLASAEVDAPRRNAEWIVSNVAGISKLDLVTHPGHVLTSAQWRRCQRMAERRANREPIQYILGYTEFFGLRIEVSPDVLIPRPETEELVEEVLSRIAKRRNPRVLDVGTGSGCIAVAIGHSRPDARLFASDSEHGALSVAGHNARQLGVRVSFFQSDVLRNGSIQALAGILDAIVSNPPYVAADEFSHLEPEVREFEPTRALVAFPDPLVYYRSLAREAGRVLRAEGHLVLECHEDRTRDVAQILAEHGLVDVEERRDLAGKPRIVAGRVPSS